jgi:hypothetical protein
MTAKERHIATRDRLLEQLLDRVESIDRNVEEILDRVSDHFDDQRLDLNWRGDGYGHGDGYEEHHE